jgi:hypothetical protein
VRAYRFEELSAWVTIQGSWPDPLRVKSKPGRLREFTKPLDVASNVESRGDRKPSAG